MGLHKLSFLVFLFILSESASAKVTKDLIKNTLNAIEMFKYYEISFVRQFKYPNESDTLSELYSSSVYFTDVGRYIGWHKISYLRTQTPRSLVAGNNEGMYRLNYKNNLYYKTLFKDNQKLLLQNLKNNLYAPLLYTREELEKFNEAGKDGIHFFLEKMDTIKDPKLHLSYIRKTRIQISRKTYIPVSEEISSNANGKEQYSLYRLVDYKMFEKNAYNGLLKTCDSLIAVIRSYPDADSIKNSRKDLYRKLKVGDTVSGFKSVLFSGHAFDLSFYKDSIVILDFFYTTCAPCIASVPELNKIHADYASKGVVLFGVDPFETDWDLVPGYIEKQGVNYPIIKTNKQALYNFGVTGYPRLFVIRNGVVVRIFYGFTKGTDHELSQLLDKLLLNP